MANTGGEFCRTRTFTAGEAIEKWRLVYLSSAGTVKKCYPGQDPIGVSAELVASGDPVAIHLLAPCHTREIMANAAIAANAPVYVAEDGKIDDVGVGAPLGWALKATTADGDVVEVLSGIAAPGSFAGIGKAIVLEDDFFHYVDADNWTLVGGDGGTAAIADAVGGVLTLGGAGATDNDETYLEQKLETFLFAAAKPIYFQARVKCTELNTDDVNLIVGLVDAVAADALVDDGAGPKASYSGMVFFKVDGGTVWQGEVSVAGTQVTDTNVGAFTSAAQHKLEMIYVPTSTTAGTVYFIVDGVLGGSSAFTFTGATEMQVVFGVKNGSANSETFLIDYVYCAQVR